MGFIFIFWGKLIGSQTAVSKLFVRLSCRLVSSKLFDLPNEREDVVGQQPGLLEGGEVAAALHVVVRDDVLEFAPKERLRLDEQLLRASRDPRRDVNWGVAVRLEWQTFKGILR